MAFHDAGIGDAHELGVVQVVDGGGAAIAHARAQPARHLVDNLLHRALVRHAAGNALGHQFLGILGVALEVAVLRAVLLLHGLQGAHAPVALELTTVIYNGVARTFLRSGHQRAHHHARPSGGQRLHDVARIAQSAVGNERHAGALQRTIHVVNGAQLGHANAGHHAGGADAAWTDAHLHRVGTVLHEHAGRLARGHVAHHDVDAAERCLGLAQFLNDATRVAVGRVDDNGVGAGIHQGLHALQRVGGDAHAGSHAQPPLLVLAGHRLVLGLRDVLIGDEAHQAVVLVNHGQLLNLVLLKYLGGGGQVRLLVSGHQVAAGHHVVDFVVQAALKAQVAVGDIAHQVALVVNNGNAADVVFGHQCQRLGHRATAADGHRVVNHAVLGTLHDGHLAGLSLYGHVLVDDANAALAGNGNGHRRFRDGVHGSRHKRHVQPDVARETRAQLYRAGQYFRISGDEKDVVESQTVHDNSVRCK